MHVLIHTQGALGTSPNEQGDARRGPLPVVASATQEQGPSAEADGACTGDHRGQGPLAEANGECTEDYSGRPECEGWHW